ncbi:hypothetical protein [Streptomyces rapamycinicus]|uniref:Uncharacterized protein n=2 Tax=Streptomyces rapamycinicus TaxID=1226757 RepID=A0A0A0N6U1_STRRN|nr:hypothetical protein [Streptomyces rapamycinicus]AGP52781.1 hypothetical protein M271_05775 [Streptomyces rapamycinicus NRRL 5491]MBB4780256.1 hypothetical protein [Streptomyces rapamycinicus]RLV75089.1 hypothetical protein D3C57_137725 [Streptomyces rapamycinicus NRRL 5491]UTO60992.1 hypothetical protein LJB45_00815 [Streptomyces rapamycinicus]UTP28936.1 hypothetical protein LIV37_05935 [Streptomyces rapamycinicus NRRL 5491]
MVHGGRTNRPAVCGGPCAAAVLLLLAATLLHAVLALGVVRASPSTGPERCATGKAGAAGVPNRAPATSVPGGAGAPVSARALAASAPAPAPVIPVPVAPEAEDERSASSAPAVFSARDGAGHPARHRPGRAAHGASCGAHRSLSTSLGPFVLGAVRGRPADPAPGEGAFGAGGDVPAGRLSSRSVVLRC